MINKQPAIFTLDALEVGYSKVRISHNVPTDIDISDRTLWVKTGGALKSSASKLVIDYLNKPFLYLEALTATNYDISASLVDDFVAGNEALLDAQYLGSPSVLSITELPLITMLVAPSITNVTNINNDQEQIGTPPSSVRFDFAGSANASRLEASTDNWATSEILYTGAISNDSPLVLTMASGTYRFRLVPFFLFSDGVVDEAPTSTYGSEVAVSDSITAPSDPTGLIVTPYKILDTSSSYNLYVNWDWALGSTGQKQNTTIEYIEYDGILEPSAISWANAIIASATGFDYTFSSVPYRKHLAVRIKVYGWNNNSSTYVYAPKLFISELATDSSVVGVQIPTIGNDLAPDTKIQIDDRYIKAFNSEATQELTFMVDAVDGSVGIGKLGTYGSTSVTHPFQFDGESGTFAVAGSIITSEIISADYVMGWLSGKQPQFRTANKSSYSDTSTGIWMGYDTPGDDTSFKLSIGSADQYIKWDGADLHISGNVTIDGGSSLSQEQIQVFLYKSNEGTPPAPTGGTFSSPISSSAASLGWSTSIPVRGDNEYIYLSQRILTSDAASPQEATWTAPGLFTTGGDTGAAAKSVNLSSNRQTVAFDESGSLIDSTDIAFTVSSSNTVGNTVWTSTPAGLLTSTTNGSAKLTTTNFGTNNLVSVTSTIDGIEDTISIVKLSDGANGVDSINALLTNESHVVVASNEGVVSSFSGSATEIKFFKGTTQVTTGLTYSATPASSSSSVAYTLVGGLLTPTGMNSGVDSHTISITATHSTYGAITKVYSLSKSKAGYAGSTIYTEYRYSESGSGSWSSNFIQGTHFFQSERTVTVSSSGTVYSDWTTGTEVKNIIPKKGTDYFDGDNGSFTSFVFKLSNTSETPVGGSYTGTETVPTGWSDAPVYSSTTKTQVSTCVYVHDGTSYTRSPDWKASVQYLGVDGVSISGITRSSTGQVTINYSNDTTDSFTIADASELEVVSVTNDVNGNTVIGMSDGSSFTIDKGDAGRGIDTISRDPTTGVVTVTFDDGGPSTSFSIEDGAAGAGMYGSSYASIEWDTPTANPRFKLLAGRDPVPHDIFTQTLTDETNSEAREFIGGIWDTVALYVNGSIVAKNTIAGDRITAGTIISAPTISGGKLLIDDYDSGGATRVTIDASASKIFSIRSGDSNLLYFDTSKNKLFFEGGVGPGTIQSSTDFSPEIWSQIGPTLSEGSTGGSFTTANSTGGDTTTSLTGTINMTNINTENVLFSCRFNDYENGVTTGAPKWTLNIISETRASIEDPYASPKTIENITLEGSQEYPDGAGRPESGFASIDENFTLSKAVEGATMGGDVRITYTVTYISGTRNLPKLRSMATSQEVLGGGRAGEATTLGGQNGDYYRDFRNATFTPTTLAGYGITDNIAYTDSNVASATKLESIGTTFNGTYPMTINAAGVIYSHTDVTYNGSAGELTAPKFVGNLTGTATNADKLDNLDSSLFMRSDITNASASIGTLSINQINFNASQGNLITDNYGGLLGSWAGGKVYLGNSTRAHDVVLAGTSGSNFQILKGGTYTDILHEGNFGKAQIDALNIDAGTLDNINSTQFLRSDIDDTTAGGLTIAGSLSRGTYADSSNYKIGADNLVLKGNATGQSGIFFESEKNGTNINHASDFGFIQYSAYGTGTEGELSELVIGVSNDGTDHVVLNAPSSTGLKYRIGSSTTDHTIWHAGNDGSGSGLDADKLEGYQADAFGNLANNQIWTGTNSFSSLGIENTSSTTKRGLALYGSGNTGKPSYGIMFSGTPGEGTHGDVTGDWATYFTQEGASSRGYIFQNNATNVASISGRGYATFNKVIAKSGVDLGSTQEASVQYNSVDNSIDFIIN